MTKTAGDKERQVRALRERRAASRRRDAIDTKIARKRLAEISARPGSLISGRDLETRLTEAIASKPSTAPVQASALPKERTMTKKAKTTKKTAKGKKRSVGEAAANLRAAKAKRERKSAKPADGAESSGPRPGSKTAAVAALLVRPEGCTTAEILAATGWPTVSVPQQAKAAGLTLSKEKDGKVTRYRGVAAPA